MTFFQWSLRILPAAILLQTLFFKFTAAPESVYIFETLGLGAAGRIGSGVVELIAAVLLLIPATTFFGSLLSAGTMFGAIVSHLTVLGIVVQNDDGLLFSLAIITLLSSLANLFLYRDQFKKILEQYSAQSSLVSK